MWMYGKNRYTLYQIKARKIKYKPTRTPFSRCTPQSVTHPNPSSIHRLPQRIISPMRINYHTTPKSSSASIKREYGRMNASCHMNRLLLCCIILPTQKKKGHEPLTHSLSYVASQYQIPA